VEALAARPEKGGRAPSFLSSGWRFFVRFGFFFFSASCLPSARPRIRSGVECLRCRARLLPPRPCGFPSVFIGFYSLFCFFWRKEESPGGRACGSSTLPCLPSFCSLPATSFGQGRQAVPRLARGSWFGAVVSPGRCAWTEGGLRRVFRRVPGGQVESSGLIRATRTRL